MSKVNDKKDKIGGPKPTTKPDPIPKAAPQKTVKPSTTPVQLPSKPLKSTKTASKLPTESIKIHKPTTIKPVTTKFQPPNTMSASEQKDSHNIFASQDTSDSDMEIVFDHDEDEDDFCEEDEDVESSQASARTLNLHFGTNDIQNTQENGPFMNALMQHNPERAFESLIYPIDCDDFFNNYFQSNVLCLSRETTDYYNGLLSVEQILQEMVVREQECNDYIELTTKWNQAKLHISTLRSEMEGKEEEMHLLTTQLNKLSQHIAMETKDTADVRAMMSKKGDKKAPLKKSVDLSLSNTASKNAHNQIRLRLRQLEEELELMTQGYHEMMQDKEQNSQMEAMIEKPTQLKYGLNLTVSTYNGNSEIILNPDINSTFDGDIYPAIKSRLMLLDTATRSGDDSDSYMNITEDDLDTAAKEALANHVLEQHDDDDNLSKDQPDTDDAFDRQLLDPSIFTGKSIDQLYFMMKDLYQQKLDHKATISAQTFSNYYRAGCNILLSQPQQYIPSLHRLLYHLETNFHTLVSSFLQIIPKHSLGTAKRYNPHGLFMLQLSGTSKLHLHNTITSPLTNTTTPINDKINQRISQIICGNNVTDYSTHQYISSPQTQQLLVPFVSDQIIDELTTQIPSSSQRLSAGDILYLPPSSTHQVIPYIAEDVLYKKKNPQSSVSALIAAQKKKSLKAPIMVDPAELDDFYPTTQQEDSITLIVTFPQLYKFSTLLKTAFSTALADCFNSASDESGDNKFEKMLPFHFNTFLGTLHDQDVDGDGDSNMGLFSQGSQNGSFDDDHNDLAAQGLAGFEQYDDEQDSNDDIEIKPKMMKNVKNIKKSSKAQVVSSDEEDLDVELARLREEMITQRKGPKKHQTDKKTNKKASINQAGMTDDADDSELAYEDLSDDFEDDPRFGGTNFGIDDDDDMMIEMAQNIPLYVVGDNLGFLHRKWLSVGNINPEYRSFIKNLRLNYVTDLSSQLSDNLAPRIMKYIHIAADELNIEFMRNRLPPPPPLDDMDTNQCGDDDECCTTGTCRTKDTSDGSEDISLEELEAMEAMNPMDDEDLDKQVSKCMKKDQCASKCSKVQQMQGSTCDVKDDNDSLSSLLQNDEFNDELDENDQPVDDGRVVLDLNPNGQILSSRSTILSSTIGGLNRYEIVEQYGPKKAKTVIENLLSSLTPSSGIRFTFPDNFHFAVESSLAQNHDDENDEDDEEGQEDLAGMENDEDDEDCEEDEDFDEDNEDGPITYAGKQYEEEDFLPLPGEDFFPPFCQCNTPCAAYTLYCSEISSAVQLPIAPRCVAFYNSMSNKVSTHMNCGDHFERLDTDDQVEHEHSHDSDDEDDEHDEDDEDDEEGVEDEHDEHDEDDEEEEEKNDIRTEFPIFILPLVRMLQEEYPRLLSVHDIELNWSTVRRFSSGFPSLLPPSLIHSLNEFQGPANSPDGSCDENDTDDDDDQDEFWEPSERLKMLYRYWVVMTFFKEGIVEIVPEDIDDINTLLADECPDVEDNDEFDEDDEAWFGQGTETNEELHHKYGLSDKQIQDFNQNVAKSTSKGANNGTATKTAPTQPKIAIKKYGDSDEELTDDEIDLSQYYAQDGEMDGEGELSLEELMSLYGGYDGEGEDLFDIDFGDEGMDLGTFDFDEPKTQHIKKDKLSQLPSKLSSSAKLSTFTSLPGAKLPIIDSKQLNRVKSFQQLHQNSSDDEMADFSDQFDEDDGEGEFDDFPFYYDFGEDGEGEIDVLDEDDEDEFDPYDDETRYWQTLLDNDDEFSEEMVSDNDIWASDEEDLKLVQLPPPQLKKGSAQDSSKLKNTPKIEQIVESTAKNTKNIKFDNKNEKNDQNYQNVQMTARSISTPSVTNKKRPLQRDDIIISTKHHDPTLTQPSKKQNILKSATKIAESAPNPMQKPVHKASQSTKQASMNKKEDQKPQKKNNLNTSKK